VRFTVVPAGIAEVTHRCAIVLSDGGLPQELESDAGCFSSSPVLEPALLTQPMSVEKQGGNDPAVVGVEVIISSGTGAHVPLPQDQFVSV
jgi:hypothetical protein